MGGLNVDEIFDVSTEPKIYQGNKYWRLDDVIAKYPAGVTITKMGVSDDGEGFQFVFAEEENSFFGAGGDLKKFGKMLLNAAQGDLTSINEALRAKPIKVRIWKTTTAQKKTYTRAERIKTEVEDEMRIKEPKGVEKISREEAQKIFPQASVQRAVVSSVVAQEEGASRPDDMRQRLQTALGLNESARPMYESEKNYYFRR